MIRLRYLTFLLLVLMVGVSTLHAASDDFIVGMQFGTDATPPTTPATITATPIAPTQIDLSWATSTDGETSVQGYQVFRDAVQIATSSVTHYSDSALTASTTYTYYVVAFDTFFNYSSSSPSVSTSTLSNPATTTPATTTVSGGAAPKIELTEQPLIATDLEVIPYATYAVIRFKTPGYVRATIYWGETQSYEIGAVQEGPYTRSHEFTVSNLKPGTRYFFSIEGENHMGTRAYLADDTFVTTTEVDLSSPLNVSNLRARKEGEDILLSWENPDIDIFDKVRILRSDVFYPADPVDGAVVYEGSGEYTRDEGAAVPGTVQYYTVFLYTKDGAVSSGAVVALRIPESGSDVVEPMSPVSTEKDEERKFNFSDIEFYQNGERVAVVGSEVLIDGTHALTVFMPYHVVPEHLKSIILTLKDRTRMDSYFSVLLRINEQKSGYEATIAPFQNSGVGVYPATVQVFDYKTETVLWTDGEIIVRTTFESAGDTTYQNGEEGMHRMMVLVWRTLGSLFFLILLILLLLAARALYRR